MANQMTSSQVAQKWARGMTGSVQSIKDGVQAMTENPMAKAAARQDAYVAGVQRAVDNGKYRDGLLSVSFEEWKRSTAEKGTQRIASGVTAASDKMTKFFDQLLPFTARVSAEIDQMPKGSESDNMARMVANFQKMSQFKFRKRA
jgi:hypothetical protein